mmetsp:Transcript_13578/g.20662  ORF Transcript_13578/g.20662 Transcript_13578/m.20662 type:complete len:231 (+) Transcript_13578:298-990(+)
MSGNTTSGSTEWMSQGNGTSMNVVVFQFQFFRTRQYLCRKGFIDFDPIHRSIQIFRRFSNGVDGSNAHNGGIASRRGVRDQACQRSQIVFVHGFLTGQDQSPGTIANARGIGGGNDTTKDGWQFRNFFHGRFGTRMFVLGQSLFFRFDRCQFGFKDARFVGGRPSLLALNGVFVALFSGNVVFFGQIFRRNAHGRARIGIGQSTPQSVFQFDTLAQRTAPSCRIRNERCL